MIQKKVCMVGVFGVGKTCLVQQFVHSIFSARYHSTVGVKIDRKVVSLDGTEATLLLWDLAGRDGTEDVTVTYLRGSHAVLYVVDGTRKETFDQVFELRELARGAIGEVPSAVALNKSDLASEWALGPGDEKAFTDLGWHTVRTSAKTGDGVEQAFSWLARAAIAAGGKPS